ncbi:cyclin-dependent kinase inhibitor 5-like [Carica papaya]|uniref:cyclin-dependent kinase inhibitor 5-like n=1 Tax=Carica papaya TaxID=3649 RepID=UPI000B8C8148|nr:cyclin-dependent kinase inhibitor 5-like [Carica papaya]
MGKYIRKSKASGEIAVMELSQASLGVRTRAKTLALQRLQKSTTSLVQPQPETTSSDASYLQLRSRRLEKPPIGLHESKRQKQAVKETCTQNPKAHKQNSNSRAGSRLRVGQGDSRSARSGSVGEKKDEVDTDNIGSGKGEEAMVQENNNDDSNKDLAVEASFGENVLEIEGRDRTTRESTPCSLIRDPDTIRTPGSTTRPASSIETNRRVQGSSRRYIPTAHEMDEFFSGAEEEQQRKFIEKYNFDPVNDKPLPGRYEWEKVDP